MKSIRVSLIVYLLALLGAAWGATSWLVYRSAAESLRAKQLVNQELLKSECRERQREEHERFDDQLLAKAQVVAHLVQTRVERERSAVARLVALGLSTEPQAHLFTPLWLLQATTRSPVTPVTPVIARRLTTRIQINEADLPRDPDAAEYFQVDHEFGIHWPAVADGEEPLFTTGTFDPIKHIESKADDVVLDDGRAVRRVQLKFVPGTRISISMGMPRGGRPGPPAPGPPPPQTAAPTPIMPFPWIVVHVAAEPVKRDTALARIKADYDQRLEDLKAEGHDELLRLRRRLVLIGVGAFLATTIGGFFLVGVGLAPLRRLSEAVRGVSPSDFQLPLTDDASLGHELAPIAATLRETLDQLRRAFEREKQAAADISHELRTPVASLMATLDVALKKPRSAEEYRQTLVECRGISRQMRQLVERLLALARLDSGVDQVRPQEVHLSEIVQDAATLVKPLASERGLTLAVDCPSEAVCNTDPDKVREILVNLLHNAIQYNRPQGSITVSAATHNGTVELQVRDTGIGIPPGDAERIFERFYRGDPSRESTGLHAGLGLSIVKGYVGLLGGTIAVESHAGRGSTFHVKLPRSAEARAGESRSASPRG